MRTIPTVAFLAISTLPVYADGPAKGVVELFTSQGCSSCPPADAAFSSVINRGGYVTLSWHVDYWNYLGWKDTFSSASATARQARYAARIGGGSYTPEFVVNGARGSSSAGSIASGGLPVSLSISGGKLNVGAGSGSGNLLLVSYLPSSTVPISRGENTGKKITYRHIVTGIRNIGTWHGAAITAKVSGGNCAVILQRPDQGEILGAANC